MTLLYIYILCN